MSLVELLRSDQLYWGLSVVVRIYWNVRFLRILSGESFFYRMIRGRSLWLERFCFEVLVKVFPYFFIKRIYFPQEQHHFSIELSDSFLKRPDLLLKQLHSIIDLLDPFPTNILYRLTLLLTEWLQLPYYFISELSVFMMLLQIVVLQKDLLADFDQLLLHEKFLSLDQFI